jgi:pimeloyl-ACP methyl ester carboxylesterase
MVEARGWVWPDTLLLAGFSQGGHVTIAALRALERNPEPGLRVAAAAPIAGPYDLSGSSFPRALEGEATHSSLYLAYLVSSYARAYGEPIDTVLRPPWDEAAPALFDGEHEAREVMEALPRDPKDLFREDFLDATAAGRPTWLGERLRENDLVDFTPRAPVRLYYGRLDVDVSPEEARRQSRRWRDRGADATAVDVGALDHDGSAIEAAVRIREWFDELTAGAASEQP